MGKKSKLKRAANQETENAGVDFGATSPYRAMGHESGPDVAGAPAAALSPPTITSTPDVGRGPTNSVGSADPDAAAGLRDRCARLRLLFPEKMVGCR